MNWARAKPRSPRTPALRAFAPRFSVRDVLWLTLAVALCVAWWRDHRAAALREGCHEDEFHTMMGTQNFAERWLDDEADFDRERMSAWLRKERAERQKARERWPTWLWKKHGPGTWR